MRFSEDIAALCPAGVLLQGLEEKKVSQLPISSSSEKTLQIIVATTRQHSSGKTNSAYTVQNLLILFHLPSKKCLTS